MAIEDAIKYIEMRTEASTDNKEELFWRRLDLVFLQLSKPSERPQRNTTYYCTVCHTELPMNQKKCNCQLTESGEKPIIDNFNEGELEGDQYKKRYSQKDLDYVLESISSYETKSFQFIDIIQTLVRAKELKGRA